MQRIRVLVVDDSVVVRRLVTDVLGAEPTFEVVGTAPNGKIALAKIEQLAPDVVTLDIEMPVMNGIETVRAVRAQGNRVPIIMFSTLTERGATATLDALAAGANDYVTKPANVGSVVESMQAVRAQLVPRITVLAGRTTRPGLAGQSGSVGASGSPGAGAAAAAGPPVAAVRPPGLVIKQPQLLVIGCSTGGPDALAKVLAAIPGTLGVPVLVVQHMPPVFTRQFAARLDRLCPLRVSEARDAETVAAGQVLIAPGDYHLEVAGSSTKPMTRLQQGPPESFCRPAVDVLFRSATAVFGGAVLAVVLTGMGSDGRLGAERIRAAGGSVLVQDEATSVVWGMPGAVAQAGQADEILPLAHVPAAVLRRLAPGRVAAPARHQLPPARHQLPPSGAGLPAPRAMTSPTGSR